MWLLWPLWSDHLISVPEAQLNDHLAAAAFRVVRGIRELLAQLQVVPDQPVAVVGSCSWSRYRWRWQSWS